MLFYQLSTILLPYNDIVLFYTKYVGTATTASLTGSLCLKRVEGTFLLYAED